jgi:hypothetical protein
MNTILHFHLIAIASVLITAETCNNKKGTTSDSTSTTTTQQQTTAAAPTQSVSPQPIATNVAPKEEGTARFVVSFYSTGQGIDAAARDEFEKFLGSYPKKIAYEPKHWGREGEVDYCLALSELSPADQVDFVSKAKNILAKSQLVHQKENSACEHNNWPALVITPATAETYRLVVSFYSTAGGIDTKVNGEFEKFLSSYPKKTAYEPTHWGREGEVDYCLKLSELSTTEQSDFIKKAKDVLNKSTIVHINENAGCVHKH